MFLQIFRKKWVTYSLFELNNPVRFFGLLCFLLVAFEVLGQHALRLNSRYVLDLSKDTVVERGLFGLDVGESYSSIVLQGAEFALSGSIFQKNGVRKVDTLFGHQSSAQGSLILPSVDSSQLFIISSYTTRGASASIFDIAKDEFQSINAPFDHLAGERFDIRQTDSSYICINDNTDGKLNLRLISRDDFAIKNEIVFDHFASNDYHPIGMIKFSRGGKYLAHSSTIGDLVTLFRLVGLDSMCLSDELKINSPYGLTFANGDSTLWVSSNNYLFRIWLSKNMIVDTIIRHDSPSLGALYLHGEKIYQRLPGSSTFNVISDLSSESPNVKTINLPFEDFARGLQFQYSADKVQTPDFSLPCSKLTTNHGIKKSVYLPVFLPNAISPNEDGINDAFRITQLTEVYDVIQLNFRAYDYRGVLFYESTSPSLEGLADLIATDKGPLFTYQLTFETIDRSLYQKYGVVQIIR